MPSNERDRCYAVAQSLRQLRLAALLLATLSCFFFLPLFCFLVVVGFFLVFFLTSPVNELHLLRPETLSASAGVDLAN